MNYSGIDKSEFVFIINLGYTEFLGELEHLKIETRLIDEKFANAMGECEK